MATVPQPLHLDFFSLTELSVPAAAGLLPNQVRPWGRGRLPCEWCEYRSSITVSRLRRFLMPTAARRASRAPLKHKQPQRSRSKTTPAMVPITIPAIAPPLSLPPLLVALAPISSAPSVPTGAMNPWVMVGAEVCVTVDAPLLVSRTPGLASPVPVASEPVTAAEELSATHSPSWHSCAASQQVVPHLISPRSILHVPVEVAM